MEKNIISMASKQDIMANMKRLLQEYDYEYTDYAIKRIVDKWAEQKANLIELLSKHPNYVDGQFLIAFNKDWNREIDVTGAQNFASWILFNAATIRENMPECMKEKRKQDMQMSYYKGDDFDWYYPITSDTRFLTHSASTYAKQFLDEPLASALNSISPTLHLSAGQKTSRAINKLCKFLGIDKLPDYNREFAKFADSVNPLKIVRHTVISINPIDYLTMSFGNSWASCHTIDKENKRDMPNSYQGAYSSGTISYMLDEVSIVFYTVTASYDGDEYYFESKINRCMFHYGEDKLVQGRVYPQDNDSNADNIYKDIREIVQKVIADCEGMTNYWTTKKGASEIGDYVYHNGTNYPDYRYYGNCCISFPKGKDVNDKHIRIGHQPICISCGHEHGKEYDINCCDDMSECTSCGTRINDDDSYWVNCHRYCRDCVTYCEYCDEYVLREDSTWVDAIDDYVCDECLSDRFTYCEHCQEYYRDGDTTYLDNYGYSVCDDCLEDHYVECDECNEHFRRRDIVHIDSTGQNYCDDCFDNVEVDE